MKKILILCVILSLLLIGCKDNSSKNKEDGISQKIDVIKTITVKRLNVGPNTDMSVEYIIDDLDKLAEIKILISSSVKMLDSEEVNYVDSSYELKLLDSDNKLIDKIKIFAYIGSENQTLGWITFESDGSSYSLNIGKLLEIIKKN